MTATLLEMKAEDQAVLRRSDVSEAEQNAVFKRHAEKLKEIVAEHGWPTISMVGKEASQGAWLIVQHDDQDRAWQRQALNLMTPLVASEEISASDVAYLDDRLSVADKQPQKYGTQGKCVATGSWQPFPLFEPELVEERRTAMKMKSLASYVEMAANMMCKKLVPAPTLP